MQCIYLYMSYIPVHVVKLFLRFYFTEKSHIALRRRARYNKSELTTISPEIQENLTSLPQHVENLRRHFLTLTDITAKTQEYLKKMLCFSNLKMVN